MTRQDLKVICSVTLRGLLQQMKCPTRYSLRKSRLRWQAESRYFTTRRFAYSNVLIFFFSLLTVSQNDCNESSPMLWLITEVMLGLAVLALHHHPKVQLPFSHLAQVQKVLWKSTVRMQFASPQTSQMLYLYEKKHMGICGSVLWT